ncbi:MAG: methyltransferase domain-containing protein [Bacteroidales bacterium]|nr:methyltransferase domain-containing protein [Bacteroidales bacterium]
MQKRHLDRWIYFTELANTSREYYIDYVRSIKPLTNNTRVFEIGCGEGGNLLPFAEVGCQVTGNDLKPKQIENAKDFFGRNNLTGNFIAGNFLYVPAPQIEEEKFDIILVHDVIEHIEPEDKVPFLQHLQKFMRKDAIVFMAFPAWQMPFGGHQQICRAKVSKFPFLHLLPQNLYSNILRKAGEDEGLIDELLSIRRSKMPIERYEKTVHRTNLSIQKRTLWFINPHYKQKFHLIPLKCIWPFSHIPYLRNFYTTSAWYILK